MADADEVSKADKELLQAWTKEGPYTQVLEIAKARGDKETQKEIEAKIDNWSRNGGLDWNYGYTKHVASILIRYTNRRIRGTDILATLGTLDQAREIARECIQRLADAGILDDFDKNVLPLKPRLNGQLPRAFLGSDVAESREGAGFQENRLRKYLRHPGIVPKSELLNWSNYSEKGDRVLDRFDKWFYSIKYDGYSAIWTGTKLVTANGRQTVYAMPQRMQDSLTAIPTPLVGELVLVQKSDATTYETKENLQAVVHGGRALSAKATSVAQRLVFMVYDTPSTELRQLTFGERTEKLGGILGHLNAATDHVELVKQYSIQEKREKFKAVRGRDVLAKALLAATATEQEGLILTPNEPYLQLYTATYRRVKLKLLFTFRVRPTIEPKSVRYTPSAQPRSLQQDPDIRPMRSATVDFEDAHGDRIDAKINFENDVWFNFKDRRATDPPFHLQLAKHRWGFSVIYSNPRSLPIQDDDYASLVKPQAVGLLVREYVRTTGLLRDANPIESTDIEGMYDLYRLFSARLMHSRVLASSGRPHYVAHPVDPSFGTGAVANDRFFGEASTQEIRQLVREASMLAEQTDLRVEPYNEWLCQVHRAYEGTSKFVLEQKRTISGRFRQHLLVFPQELLTYYERDYTAPGDRGNATYKLVTVKPTAQDVFRVGEKYEDLYFIPEAGETLRNRVLKSDLDDISRGVKVEAEAQFDVPLRFGAKVANAYGEALKEYYADAPGLQKALDQISGVKNAPRRPTARQRPSSSLRREPISEPAKPSEASDEDEDSVFMGESCSPEEKAKLNQWFLVKYNIAYGFVAAQVVGFDKECNPVYEFSDGTRTTKNLVLTDNDKNILSNVDEYKYPVAMQDLRFVIESPPNIAANKEYEFKLVNPNNDEITLTNVYLRDKWDVEKGQKNIGYLFAGFSQRSYIVQESVWDKWYKADASTDTSNAAGDESEELDGGAEPGAAASGAPVTDASADTSDAAGDESEESGADEGAPPAAGAAEPGNAPNYNTMSRDQLRVLAKERGLKSGGTKAVLAKRLEGFDQR